MLGVLPTMSLEEVDRVLVIQQVVEKRIKQREAAKQLHLSARQARRLVREFRRTGSVSVISKHRGRPSNHRLKPEMKQQVEKLVRIRYPDFGDSHLKCVNSHNPVI